MFPYDVRPYGELYVPDPQATPPTEQERDTGISYARLRRWIVNRLKYDCQLTANFKFGCHSPRVTFYFFCALSSLVYGLNLAFEVVKRNARHKDKKPPKTIRGTRQCMRQPSLTAIYY
jgi:hypothetical protein